MPGHDISERLVHELLVEQFPRWARLPVRAVAAQGWDNRTFRIGDDLAARLPSAEDYAAGILKEETVLPLLQGRMPVRIPEAVATGRPSQRFAWPGRCAGGWRVTHPTVSRTTTGGGWRATWLTA